MGQPFNGANMQQESKAALALSHPLQVWHLERQFLGINDSHILSLIHYLTDRGSNTQSVTMLGTSQPFKVWFFFLPN